MLGHLKSKLLTWLKEVRFKFSRISLSLRLSGDSFSCDKDVYRSEMKMLLHKKPVEKHNGSYST